MYICTSFCFQSLSHFHTLATIYIVRVNAESQNYRYESIQTTAGIIDPNEICIAMIDGNLSILVHLLDLSFFSSSNNFLGERNALFLLLVLLEKKLVNSTKNSTISSTYLRSVKHKNTKWSLVSSSYLTKKDSLCQTWSVKLLLELSLSFFHDCWSKCSMIK